MFSHRYSRDMSTWKFDDGLRRKLDQLEIIVRNMWIWYIKDYKHRQNQRIEPWDWSEDEISKARMIWRWRSLRAFIGIEKLRYMDLRAGCTTYTTPMDICVWCIHVCSSHICINISSFLCFLFFNNALWPYSCISIWNLFV